MYEGEEGVYEGEEGTYEGLYEGIDKSFDEEVYEVMH